MINTLSLENQNLQNMFSCGSSPGIKSRANDEKENRGGNMRKSRGTRVDKMVGIDSR
jgi:hypothetical protein